jgi:hypothetical protein
MIRSPATLPTYSDLVVLRGSQSRLSVKLPYKYRYRLKSMTRPDSLTREMTPKLFGGGRLPLTHPPPTSPPKNWAPLDPKRCLRPKHDVPPANLPHTNSPLPSHIRNPAAHIPLHPHKARYPPTAALKTANNPSVVRHGGVYRAPCVLDPGTRPQGFNSVLWVSCYNWGLMSYLSVGCGWEEVE